VSTSSAYDQYRHLQLFVTNEANWEAEKHVEHVDWELGPLGHGTVGFWSSSGISGFSGLGISTCVSFSSICGFSWFSSVGCGSRLLGFLRASRVSTGSA